MYTIIKVLNNNALLAQHTDLPKEVVFLGKGIGFQYKLNDCVEAIKDAKQYDLQEQTSKGSSKEILAKVDGMDLEIAHRIIALAQAKFTTIDENILLPLADHISFAIERIKKHMNITNPFANDIRLLFPDEYDIAQQGKELIKAMRGYEINEDEVGYITLHVHAARGEDQVDKSMLVAVIVNDSIKEIEKECNISIDVRSLSYSRLLMHMKYMLARIQQGEKLNLDMEDYTKKNFPYAYKVANNICKRVEATIHQAIPRIEVGYLALHIERIRNVEETK